MIQISITNNASQLVTNQASFADGPTADAWLEQEEANGSFGDPSTYTVSRVDISAQVAQQQAVVQAQAYLASTDWMVVRFADNGTPVPADVKAQREAMRLVINPPAQGK